ncbi:asparagine-rich protein-like [Saccostrea echinata]|uniref:asparagine-rich protein-like n=1 Tax=Saccostrea echinata TaxID=191078 RepID=UPI002A81C7E3|nr:asparagine-rich protein-like [Saccostrea echinata]
MNRLTFFILFCGFVSICEGQGPTRTKQFQANTAADIVCDTRNIGDTVTWYKNNDVITEATFPNLILYENILGFPSISESDSGTYTCVINGELSTAQNTIVEVLPSNGQSSFDLSPGVFDNMANDPTLLLEPNPRAGLLPPSKPSKRKKALLPSMEPVQREPTNIQVDVPMEPPIQNPDIPFPDTTIGPLDQPMGPTDPPMINQPMGPPETPMIDQSMGLTDQQTGRVDRMGPPDQQMGPVDPPPPPTTLPPEVPRGNSQFSLTGSEVVKEWLPSNFQENIPGLDAMMPSDPAIPPKSVNQIFNRNLGSVQLPNSGGRRIPNARRNNERPIVDSQFPVQDIANVVPVQDAMGMGEMPVTDTTGMDQMANAVELGNNFGNFPEFGNAIDMASPAERGTKILDIASGIVPLEPNAIPGSQRNEQEYTVFHEMKCRLRAHFTPAGIDQTRYEEYLNGDWKIRYCAPGSGYNVTTCGCNNILTGRYPLTRPMSECRPEIALIFRGNQIINTAGSNDSVDATGVDIRDRSAYFDGSNRLYFWKYQYYEYDDKLQISFKFKPKPGLRMEPYTLVSNCEGENEPSFGIVLNSFDDVATFFIKTDEAENQGFFTIEIDPNTWNDVYFRYKNGQMIGKINDKIAVKPLTGRIQKRPDTMVFGSCNRYGNFTGQLRDITTYTKCLPPLDRQVERKLG